jgi:hypothetical protein
VTVPDNIVPFFQPGRLIKVQVKSNDDDSMQDWGWGILVNFKKMRLNPKNMLEIGRKNRQLQEIIEQNE